jgi:hypothetical protein
MESIPISGLTLYYDATEEEAADEIVIACERSVGTISGTWQMEAPMDCRVYIMTAWPRCVFQGAPLGSQIVLGLTLPFWYAEFKKRWLYSGGWSQGYGERQVVGIKTPRLLAQTPEPIGASIFIREEDLERKVLSIVCHELTHAFSSYLQLPTWLNEGLAMVSADRCLGKPTVLHETLHLLGNGDQVQTSAENLNLKTQSREEIVLLYVRGYWLTRYLADTRPGLTNLLLSKKYSHQELEGLIAAELDIPQNSFWQDIDQRVVDTYNLELT